VGVLAKRLFGGWAAICWERMINPEVYVVKRVCVERKRIDSTDLPISH
jgi:hypothetical protein